MGVSKNSGTPKSSISIGYYKPSILGYPYLWILETMEYDNEIVLSTRKRHVFRMSICIYIYIYNLVLNKRIS